MLRCVRRRANFERAVAHFDRIQPRNHFEVDQMAIVQRRVLHGQQQFGAAGVDARLFAVMRQHLRRFAARWQADEFRSG